MQCCMRTMNKRNQSQADRLANSTGKERKRCETKLKSQTPIILALKRKRKPAPVSSRSIRLLIFTRSRVPGNQTLTTAAREYTHSALVEWHQLSTPTFPQQARWASAQCRFPYSSPRPLPCGAASPCHCHPWFPDSRV